MRLSLLSLFTFLVLACESGKKENVLEHSVDGVSIKYSSNWILESEDLDGEGHYLSLEKKGFESSGLYQLYWLYDNENTEILLEEQKNELLSQINSIQFNETFKTKYVGYDAIATEYKIPPLEIEGIIISFSLDDKGFVVVKQQDYNTDSINKKGFDIVEKSLSIGNSDNLKLTKSKSVDSNLFLVKQVKNLGVFEFKKARKGKVLFYTPSDSIIIVTNNTGNDIINTSSPQMIIDVQVGEIKKRYGEKLNFKEEVSTENPWLNGESKTIIKGYYDFILPYDKYALKTYEVKKADLTIDFYAENRYIDFSFEDTIFRKNIKDQLISFKKNIE